jgi:hypothetical protein
LTTTDVAVLRHDLGIVRQRELDVLMIQERHIIEERVEAVGHVIVDRSVRKIERPIAGVH